MSKGRVSFIALSAGKRNLRGCVEGLHRAWASSRCVRMSWKNVPAKYLGSGMVSSAEKLPKGCLSRTPTSQNYCNARFLWTFKRCNPSCGLYLPISALVCFFLVLASLCSYFRQHRVKVRTSQLYSLASLTHYLFSSSIVKIVYT